MTQVVALRLFGFSCVQFRIILITSLIAQSIRGILYQNDFYEENSLLLPESSLVVDENYFNFNSRLQPANYLIARYI